MARGKRLQLWAADQSGKHYHQHKNGNSPSFPFTGVLLLKKKKSKLYSFTSKEKKTPNFVLSLNSCSFKFWLSPFNLS